MNGKQLEQVNDEKDLGVLIDDELKFHKHTAAAIKKANGILGIIYDQLENRISFHSLNEIEKITPELVEEATDHLKCSKSDPIFEFNSDCLKNARRILFEHMATLFKTYLVHGHVSSILTMSTLVPILKIN